MTVAVVQGSETPRYAYSKADFDRVSDMLMQKAGIKLADSKHAMVYSRLSRRLTALKLDNFEDYLDVAETQTSEQEHFINALTTNLTAFFRESHHFCVLREYLEQHRGPLTIWCAASSTGEEPYSIAMTVADVYQSFKTPVKIIASDIDSNVLRKAHQGIYHMEAAKGLSTRQLHSYFQKGTGSRGGMIRARDELRDMIELKKLNLTQFPWDLPKHIDLVFCRNVMIYFDKPTQQRVLENMMKFLDGNGLYFAGHSENFSDITERLKLVGRSVYKPVFPTVV